MAGFRDVAVSLFPPDLAKIGLWRRMTANVSGGGFWVAGYLTAVNPLRLYFLR
jgi:hypothetical protein